MTEQEMGKMPQRRLGLYAAIGGTALAWLYFFLTLLASYRGIQVPVFDLIAKALWNLLPQEIVPWLFVNEAVLLWVAYIVIRVRRIGRKAGKMGGWADRKSKAVEASRLPHPVPVAVTTAAPQKVAKPRRRCPNCHTFTKKDALVCVRCSSPLDGRSIDELLHDSFFEEPDEPEPALESPSPPLAEPDSITSRIIGVVDGLLDAARNPKDEAVGAPAAEATSDIPTARVPAEVVAEAAEQAEAELAAEAPSERDLENGYLSDEAVVRIVRHAELAHRLRQLVTKAVAAIGLAAVFLLIVTNLDAALQVGLSILFWFVIFIKVNQTYPALMGTFYTFTVVLVLVVYAIPFRMTRKKLALVYDRQMKYIGRVTLVKGADHGYPPDTITYGAWYAWRYWKWWLTGRRRGVTWDEARPSPHELPRGDVYYLLGNETTAVNQFRYVVRYVPNYMGILSKMVGRGKKTLYTNAKIETSAWVMRLVGDGVNILEVPRLGDHSIPHQELTPLPPTYHPRDISPYRSMVEDRLEHSADLVDRGVRSDAALAKESIKSFAVPAPSQYYKGLMGERAREDAMKHGRKPPREEFDEEGPPPPPLTPSESYGVPPGEEDEESEEHPPRRGRPPREGEG